MTQPGRLAWANALRGVAALLVAGGHLVIAVVIALPIAQSVVRQPGEPDVDQSRALAQWIDSLGFDFMAAGVCAFFLLSGLVIARSLQRYSRTGFLIGRGFRLLPTYAVAYLLGCGAVIMLAWVDSRPIPVTAVEVLGGLIPGVDILFQVPSLPNGIAWTLMVEIGFYGLCVVFHRRLVTSAVLRLVIAGGCVVLQSAALSVDRVPGALLGLWLFVGIVLPFLPILMIGVHLSAVGEPAKLRPRDGAVIVLLFVAFLWMSQRAGTPYVVPEVEWWFTYSVVTAVFIALWAWAGSRGDGPVLAWFAAISYPLYVLHLLVGWAVIIGLTVRGVPSLLAQGVAVIVVLALSWAVHLTVEAPTHRLGQRLARRVSERGDDEDHVSAVTPVPVGSDPSTGPADTG